MQWIVIGLVLGGLYLWNRSANAAAAAYGQQADAAYLGQTITIGPGSPPVVTARVHDVVSLTGAFASQVALNSPPGMLAPITGGLLPGVAPADWGITSPGTAVFTYPGGTTTVVATT